MSKMSERIESVRKWQQHRGKRELVQHLSGNKLSYKQAVLAKCYDCNCGYDDGAVDCKIEACPLYGFMPYRENKLEKKTNRTMTEEHKAKLLAGRHH